MSGASARIRLRELLDSDSCHLVAPIFDPMSTRIAQEMGWEIAKLSSSITKAVNFGLPDEVDGVMNITDYADVVRRIRRVASDIPLLIDVDDAGGTRLAVFRAVRELEAVGISAIEIEDRIYPRRFDERQQSEPGNEWSAEGCVFHSIDEQVALLKTALAAREDPNTVITARTAAFNELQTGPALTKDEALERLRAYAQTGVDAIMLPGVSEHVRADIEAAHGVTSLPLCVLRMPADVYNDEAFLARNNVRVRYLGTPVFMMAARAIHDSLRSLQQGGSGTGQTDLQVSMVWPELVEPLKLVSRWSEFREIDRADAG